MLEFQVIEKGLETATNPTTHGKQHITRDNFSIKNPKQK